MTMTREFAPGGYRFIPGPFQYSGGGGFAWLPDSADAVSPIGAPRAWF